MPFMFANMIGERRCECSTKQPGVEGHYNGNMLDPAYARKPRDLTHHRDVVSATEATDGIACRCGADCGATRVAPAPHRVQPCSDVPSVLAGRLR